MKGFWDAPRTAGLSAMQTEPKPSSQIKTLMNLKRRFLLYVVLTGAFGVMTVARAGVFENQETAEEAYIYAFPMIAAYKAMYQFNIDKSSDQYKTGFNQIWNDAHVFTPKDTAIVTPNSDTPYSMLQADLRAEPIVLCVPEIEKDRYYSVQLCDMYSCTYAYIGSRSIGNGAGCYMVAGPNWSGEKPPGIDKVFQCETQFSFIIYRTQLFNAADMDNVKKIQAGYKVQPLSAFLNKPAPPAQPLPDFPKFTDAAFKKDAFAYLNFLLQFCPAVPEETEACAVRGDRRWPRQAIRL